MNIQPKPVAGAVRQAGKLIIRAETGRFQAVARGPVHIRAGSADFGCGKGRRLRVALGVPEETLPFRRFAKDIGAGDIGTIAMKNAAKIDQHHIAFAERLRMGHAMRIGRRLAKLHRHEKRLQAKGNMRRINEISDFRGGNAGTQTFEHGLLHAVTRVHRRLDDGDLGCGFDLPLGDDHRLGGNDAPFKALHEGRCENKGGGGIDGDKMTGTGQGTDTSCHQVEGTFILLPDGNLTRNADERLKLRLLEGRADIDRHAFRRHQGAVNALGKTKRQAGIIGQRR